MIPYVLEHLDEVIRNASVLPCPVCGCTEPLSIEFVNDSFVIETGCHSERYRLVCDFLSSEVDRLTCEACL